MAGLHNTYGIAARNFTAYPEMPDIRQLVDYGVRMEQMGFDSLWVWDQILLGVEPNFPIHEVRQTHWPPSIFHRQGITICDW